MPFALYYGYNVTVDLLYLIIEKTLRWFIATVIQYVLSVQVMWMCHRCPLEHGCDTARKIVQRN